MTDLQQTIQQKANGGLKLDPDQQRKFLETFEERVLAETSIAEAEQPELQAHFKDFLEKLQEEYQPLYVKISPKLTDQTQLFYLKTAQNVHIDATIVSSDCARSPFGVIIHTDHAVNKTDRNLYQQLTQNATKKPEEKKSFWHKLFS